MDIQNKRLVKGACGNAVGEYPATHWFVRAGSWQYGAEASPEAVEAEKREDDLKWGTPHADNLPDPGTQSNDVSGALPNPHNFSSNPGFMSVSTGDMATSGAPRSGGTATIATPGAGRSLRRGNSGGTGTIGRTAVASKGNVSLPAPGDINPGQEGGPQVVSSGYSG